MFESAGRQTVSGRAPVASFGSRRPDPGAVQSDAEPVPGNTPWWKNSRVAGVLLGRGRITIGVQSIICLHLVRLVISPYLFFHVQDDTAGQGTGGRPRRGPSIGGPHLIRDTACRFAADAQVPARTVRRRCPAAAAKELQCSKAAGQGATVGWTGGSPTHTFHTLGASLGFCAKPQETELRPRIPRDPPLQAIDFMTFGPIMAAAAAAAYGTSSAFPVCVACAPGLPDRSPAARTRGPAV